MIPHSEMILRIATGAVLGGVIGFERDIHGRQAGLRTHLLVAMAAATFMVVSNHFVYFQGYESKVEADVSRIAASVVSGIGFLAGGAILKTGLTVHGLTTAAALWLVAAIGLAAGGGMYVEGVAVTGLGLLALTVMRLFEDKNDRILRRRVSVTLGDNPHAVSGVMAALTATGTSVPDFDYEKGFERQSVTVTFEARIPVSLGVRGLIEVLETQAGVRHVHVRSRE